ncbi:allantoinase [Anopheles bellator]|uniref:allantoinase n=1 Tax=Anopheles bellator TaxID=139047 RepID=UPI002648B3D5|nr:allantoinase [Anopheles bellator]
MEALYTSSRIYLNSATRPAGLFAGGLLISTVDGRVTRVLDTPGQVNAFLRAHHDHDALEHYDFGDLVLMPGLIDTHVHINEPGRTEWEGFHTATKAAAAGGFTTLCDMPLNSIPPTTSVANLRTKLAAARGKLFVDVAFWGGLVPDNLHELRRLIATGVIGFKCFLCPSGVDEFPHVTEEQLHLACRLIEGTGAVLAFHAELECQRRAAAPASSSINPLQYRTFLQTRPDSMEQRAIELVARLAEQYDVRAHIVHLSSARALPTIRRARANGARLTVETCHHYLALAAEDVPDAGTQYKCCPPIRGRSNQQRLWDAICAGDIDLVVSDHSPSTPELKLMGDGPVGKRRGNFLDAWGGIASVQFGLPLFWTHCQQYGLTLDDAVRLLCTEPARLCSMDGTKGRLDPGYDGDLCVWDPAGTFTVTEGEIEFQHKGTTPYLRRTLTGVVHATFLRGTPIYRRDGRIFGPPLGNILRRSTTSTGTGGTTDLLYKLAHLVPAEDSPTSTSTEEDDDEDLEDSVDL